MHHTTILDTMTTCTMVYTFAMKHPHIFSDHICLRDQRLGFKKRIGLNISAEPTSRVSDAQGVGRGVHRRLKMICSKAMMLARDNSAQREV